MSILVTRTCVGLVVACLSLKLEAVLSFATFAARFQSSMYFNSCHEMRKLIIWVVIILYLWTGCNLIESIIYIFYVSSSKNDIRHWKI